MERQKNYLAHFGIKGMKWKNHTYKSIVGGEYIYDTAQITNTAAQMKKQGYSHDEIKATIRSNMANTRAANASPGGNYSGAMNRAKQTVASQNKPQVTTSTNKYQSELNKAKSNAAAEAASKEKELEQKHATYEKEKAERKEQKEKERAAQEAAAAAEKAEKEAKKNKKKGSGGKKGSSSKKKTEDKKKEQEELQKKIDEGVKKELEKMGLSSQAMSKDGQQKSKLSDEQLDSLANKAIRGDLGNGAQRKAALGDYYQEVQSLVNKKMSERAEVAKGAKSPEKKQELKWTGKKVKHTMMTGSNYIVHSTYLEHHGVMGQVKGLRRYQNYDGSLTPLGREHYGIGPSRYQNADGTLTEKGIKKYTTLDKKTGARVLNKKGEKFYKKFESKVTKQAVKDVTEENKKLVKRRATLSDEEIEQLTNRLNAEKKLRDAYGSTSMWQQAKDNIGKAVARKGSEFVVDIALGAVAAAGQKAIEKSLNGKIGSLNLSDYMNKTKEYDNQERLNKYVEAEKQAKADYDAAVSKNRAEKDRLIKMMNPNHNSVHKYGKAVDADASSAAITLMNRKNEEARKQYEKVAKQLESARKNYEESYYKERAEASERMLQDLKRRRENNSKTANLLFPTPGSRDKK